MGNADQSEDITTDLPDQIAISTIDRMNNSLRHSTNFHQRTSANNTSENYESENVSRIYIAYSISSVFCVLHTLWFIFLYFTKKGNKRSNDDSQMTMEHSNDPTQMTIEHSNYPTQMTKEHSNDPTQMTIEHSNDPTHLNEKVNGHSSGQGYTNNQEHSNVLEPSNGTVNDYSKVGAARPSQKVKDTSGGHIPRELQFLGLVFMVIMAAISNAIDFSFSTYLSSFCVEFLHWSKASGSMITSLLFIMVVLGGTLSMFLTKCINSVIYIGLQMILILVSLILLLLSINFHLTVGVWLSAPLLGFAKSAIFPLIISWTNKTFIRVSGRISSAFFVGAMGGSSINLFMLASVMESTGKIWFCYVLIVESILLILFFITTVILSQYVKHWKRKQAAKANENESTYTFTDG
ncbi:uncharacterized protein LOC110458998 isoform X2 [Mizuhopecten yessoensis]|nr:uncharacterized protein LOC110458998 isoform X2 [Mizuhopecten yessoensis]